MNVSAARSLLHAFFLEHPEGDAEAYESLRARHPEYAADLDRLRAEVLRLRGALNLTPASIVASLEVDSPRAGVEALPPPDHRSPRLRGFDVGEQLGRGGMGVVWKGRDVELGRTVAVKVLRESLAADEDLQRRFVTEARITGQLQHPGIVPIYRLGVSTEGWPFISMKLIEGRTLAQILAERESVQGPMLELLTIFTRICEAVAYAHSRGVVHRDLKPANVMVGPFGEVQVLDWGLAKVLDDGSSGAVDSVITPVSPESPVGGGSLTGTVVGSPPYMAPEQAAGEVERIGPRADVFSLGSVLCELLTERPAYPGRRLSPGESGRLLFETHRRLDECSADRDLVDLTLACLAEDPESRPPHAGAVAQATSGYLASVDQRARDAELEAARTRERSEQESRARRQALLLGSVIVGALLVAATAVRKAWRHQVIAAERTADVLETARTLFERGDYSEAASFARAGGLPLKSELAQLLRNAELMASLAAAYPRVVPYLDASELNDLRGEFERAFEDYGVEVLGDEAGLVAKRLRVAGLADRVRPFLDYWALAERSSADWMSENRSRLLALAANLDPEPVRRDLRRLLAESTEVEEIRAFLAPGYRGSLDSSSLILVLGILDDLYGDPARMGDISDAREAARGVLDRDPDAVEVLVQLGAIGYGLGVVEMRSGTRSLDAEARSFFHEAIGHLSAACALDPDHTPARSVLARTYALLEDERGREAAFEEALRRMRVGRRRENRLLSREMARVNSADRVVAHLEEMLEVNPRAADIACDLAWSLCHTDPKRADRAVEFARRAVDLEPDVRENERVLAMALFFLGEDGEDGEYGECVDLLRALREDGETTPYLDLMLAIAYHDHGFEDPEDLGRKALRRMVGNPDLLTRSVVERARVIFPE